MKKLTLFVVYLLLVSASYGQLAQEFSATDVLTGKTFSLSDHGSSKAVVLVFTSLNCPFSKLYEDRIVQLHSDFSDDGFLFALVNPHLGLEEGESESEAKARAAERKINFPILDDRSQELSKQFGITKLPEVIVITPSPTGWAIAYRGAIDNNPQVANNANMKYVESALLSIENRRIPSPTSTRPVGCNLKSR